MTNPTHQSIIFAIGCLAKVVDLRATRVESSVPKLVEPAIAKPLRPYVKVEAKQYELMEAHKLRIYRLESMNDDHKKELASLKNRVVQIVKAVSGSEHTSTLKTDLDILKNEVTSFWSTDLSIFLDKL